MLGCRNVELSAILSGRNDGYDSMLLLPAKARNLVCLLTEDLRDHVTVWNSENNHCDTSCTKQPSGRLQHVVLGCATPIIHELKGKLIGRSSHGQGPR